MATDASPNDCGIRMRCSKCCETQLAILRGVARKLAEQWIAVVRAAHFDRSSCCDAPLELETFGRFPDDPHVAS